MNEVEKILENYYNNYDEDSRLIKNKAHMVEYITTTKYIEKYLKKGDRILEVGAGTGRYSINYAQKGYQVDSIELVNKNLEILKSKITKNMNIKAMQGNCLNLNMYKENTFDITLVLGPMYHLYEDADINNAIEEVIRVTKPGGKIFLAFISSDAIVLSYGLRKGNLRRLKELCGENWKLPRLKEEVFAPNRLEDIDNLTNKFNVNRVETIAIDGVAEHMQDYINSLSEEDFEIFVDYHLKTCNRKELIGYSSHILEIVEKR